MQQQIHNEEEFRQAVSGNELSVVKFYTTWCPDCRRVNTFIDDVIAKYPDMKFYEANSEEIPNVADEFEVMGAPSFLIFQDGAKVAHLHSRWAKTQKEIESFLDTKESKTISR